MIARLANVGQLAQFALLACVAACEPPTEPIAPAATRLLVQGVLDAGADFQWVRVDRISGGFSQPREQVPGADVTITTPDGTVIRGLRASQKDQNGATTFAYGFPTLGISGIPLVPGGTYTLRVRTPDGEEASGTTTMPEFPLFELPVIVTSFVRARDTLRVSWPRVQRTASYQVDVRSTFRSGGEFGTTYTVFTDTTITIAGTARTFENEEVFRVGSSATVSVVAVDDNYYTYYHPVVDPFAGAPPSRLTGAVGVFGSVAPVRLITFLEVR
jgi:hypothetical protein